MHLGFFPILTQAAAFAFLAAILCPLSVPAALPTPLAQAGDTLGAALQQTMIWAPAGTRTESAFVAFRKRVDLATASREATLHLFAEDSGRNKNGPLKSWPPWLPDGRRSPTGRLSFSSWRLWKKEDPLPSSGLLGPVVLRSSVRLPQTDTRP